MFDYISKLYRLAMALEAILEQAEYGIILRKGQTGIYELDVVSKEYHDKRMETEVLDGYGGDNIIETLESCVKDKCGLT